MNSIQDTVTLHNGVKMPQVGLGVYKVTDDQEVETAVKEALKVGYRSVDTASFYGNEEAVGRAIRDSGVPRETLFITTKVWNDEQGYESTLEAFERSRHKLGLEIIDLYLIHWPIKETFQETWRALEKIYEEGKVRAIGVSNFLPHHLEALLPHSTIVPMVNQVEYHPWLTQLDLHAYCNENHIQLEAWSPLTRGRKLDDPFLLELAKKYGKTPAQIILRWDLQQGVVTIPKSVTPARIQENADIFDFSLTEEDQKKLSELNEERRFGSHPDEIF
ncbi:aldo/keto reductase [Alkalicoccus daliensis]|uniref:Aldo/keto reductase n=1 Tax=Alkalicoccus daliensis TaxID=745820 RepID=A0A1H0K3M3_9BACI|nr:aldo/keto reductase [Alkalicoccus daliensis]SDO50625.1 Aldo/keto reductase [Alkalicoccus daliensis]